MKILIDMGHPAHVHYFKNLIRIMKSRGHQFLVTARDKEVTHQLLRAYNIAYISRGKGRRGFWGKLLYLIEGDLFLLKIARNFDPDIFLSFGSSYAAHVAWLLRKPHIAFDDTEHAKLEHIMYVPFSSLICTPSCFKKDFGKKQIRFDGYMELCYLHPKYFSPKLSTLNIFQKNKIDNYIILRFVSWNASHDFGSYGLTLENKRKFVIELSKYARIFISSEEELPDELKKYQLRISPEKMHDVLAFSSLFIGEGATMASECAMIGTPAIYVNPLNAGSLEEQEKYGLVFGFRNSNGVIEKAIELLKIKNLKEEWQKRRQIMLKDKIDVTSFLLWFVEDYPNSVKVMKRNPSFQYNFK